MSQLHAALGASKICSFGYGSPQVNHHFERARQLNRNSGDINQQFVALYGKWWYSMVADSTVEGKRLGLELASIAEQSGDVALKIMATRACGYIDWQEGNFDSAIGQYRLCRKLVEAKQLEFLAHRFGGSDPFIGLSSMTGFCHCYLGYLDQGITTGELAVQMSVKVNHPVTECFSRLSLAQVYQLHGRIDDVREQTEIIISIAERLSLKLYSGWAPPLLGWAQAHGGDIKQGIENIRRGIDLSESTGTLTQGTAWRALLAGVYLIQGNLDACEATPGEARKRSELSGERFWASEIARLQGNVATHRGDRSDIEEAENHLNHAVDIARQQNARLWELRSSIDLAALWANQHRIDDARQLLHPVSSWFSEGGGHPDVIKARQLLQSLQY